MELDFVIAGRLTRDFILPPLGHPLLDVPGGGALYAAGGALPWDKGVGLLGRLGEDYPRPWLKDFAARGLNIDGLRILPQSADLRAFHAYNEKFEITHGSPVSQFARRGLTFPKSLLGYQSPPEVQKDTKTLDPLSPLPTEIPSNYLQTHAVHLCPLDFTSHSHLSATFRSGSITTLTLDPSPGYMIPAFFKDLRVILASLTAFLPSEEELRSLFWGQTHDLWEMAAALGEYGCEVIVIKCGGHGQLIYDAIGKHKWELPAYPARPADPTGVGDAFCGGFLVGYRKSYDPLEAALYGNVSASLKVEGSGIFYPLDVMPGLAEARLSVLRELVRKV